MRYRSREPCGPIRTTNYAATRSEEKLSGVPDVKVQRWGLFLPPQLRICATLKVQHRSLSGAEGTVLTSGQGAGNVNNPEQNWEPSERSIRALARGLGGSQYRLPQFS